MRALMITSAGCPGIAATSALTPRCPNIWNWPRIASPIRIPFENRRLLWTCGDGVLTHLVAEVSHHDGNVAYYHRRGIKRIAYLSHRFAAGCRVGSGLPCNSAQRKGCLQNGLQGKRLPGLRFRGFPPTSDVSFRTKIDHVHRPPSAPATAQICKLNQNIMTIFEPGSERPGANSTEILRNLSSRGRCRGAGPCYFGLAAGH